jgi:Ca-activated chloride channel family protein
LIAAPTPQPDIQPNYYQDFGRDEFETVELNPVKKVSEEPVSTFSIDVDTASYTAIRKMLNNGQLPPQAAVRLEEMINYFDYDYPLSESKETPFTTTIALHDNPWAEGKQIMHVGVQGYEVTGEKPRSNLVFLLDVSGSMNAPDKLPLLKNSFKLLLDSLDKDDTIAIATYAGAAGTVLEPTKVREKQKILQALDNLRAGGSTAGAAGIKLAYQLAEANFDEDAVNRVFLATDGDFNVGITNRDELQDFVERKRESGVFLSVLGFGIGNYNDALMQKLAQNGNGNAAYIDSLSEARKVLVEEASATLFPIAKDVKIQIEFNPDKVAEYRLLGYETRHLNREDFNNDAVDAGEVGSGSSVTAIYEITPKGSEAVLIDDLRYGKVHEAEKREQSETEFSDEYAFFKLRYKRPDEDRSRLITESVTEKNVVNELNDAPDYLPFSTAVAAFGMKLRGDTMPESYSYDDIIELAQSGKGADPFGYRAEFINLVRLAKSADAMRSR